MQTHRYLVPSIVVMALLVFAGQGCPGQESAPTDTNTMEGETHMEETNGADDSEEMATSIDTAFDLALPANTTQIRRDVYERDNPLRTQTVLALSMPDTDLADVHAHFTAELKEDDWEIIADHVGEQSQTLNAEKDAGAETIVIGTSKPLEEGGDMRVNISHQKQK